MKTDQGNRVQVADNSIILDGLVTHFWVSSGLAKTIPQGWQNFCIGYYDFYHNPT